MADMSNQPKRAATNVVRLTPAARDALRDLAYALTGTARKRVSLSQAVTAACSIASDDLAAAAARLPDNGQDDDE